MPGNYVIDWLLEGDVSIQYQTYRDLLQRNKNDLQNRIENEGWGADFLSRQNKNGQWGTDFYQPKWTSTHYTLLDIKNLAISPRLMQIKKTIEFICKQYKAADGGINPGKTISQSDICINGMFLNYACYFGIEQELLISIIDFVLDQQMSDGGFNCRSNRMGAVHSSVHTTISILEGIQEYQVNGYKYRLQEFEKAKNECIEFILEHKLFRSSSTGNIIDKKFLMLSYPSRWKYDILRCLDFFQNAGIQYDPRMQDALDLIISKRKKDGKWPLQAKHPGQTHFDMEKTGSESRWNTLRALRVLKYYNLL
ncbi:MAG: hypothetical protein ACM3PT_06285 [Deltaproteobacteria bacterium]